ncbi:MAG: hypothetical protein NZ898_04470 [Myxococcota bacterium]|nr:hypothetical protein [Myxococcota bacterium]MDW8362052.1 diacylglycerol kinase family protein [Myxococcales bacterium]
MNDVSTQRRSTPPPAAAAPPAPWSERFAVVVNGNARRADADLVAVLDEIVASGDLFVSRSLDEGREIARLVVERGYPTVLTGGGDGTFTQTVTWIVREAERRGVPPPRFGLLRLGTGNALAWVVGAGRDRRRGVLQDLLRLRDAGSRSLRLLDVEGTLTMFAGVGVDAVALLHFAQVKRAFARVPLLRRVATGGIAYTVSIVGRTLPEYLVRPRHRVRVVNEGADAYFLDAQGRPVRTIAPGEIVFEGTCRMVCASTIPYWGFGARIFPFAEEREDRFSLRIVDIDSLDVVRHIRDIWSGRYRSERLHDVLAERVTVELEQPVALQVGGEAVGERRRVCFALHPRPIRVVDHYAPPGT